VPKPDTHTVACRMLVKVVPGSRKTAIVGPLGDRLKIKVAAAPENGRANVAVCSILAERLCIAVRSVEIVVGHTNPEKTVRIAGLSAEQVRALLLA